MVRKLFPLLLVLTFILSCATTVRTPIHKVVGSDTIRAKVVLLENPEIDLAYQKTAVREYEAKLLSKPVTLVIKSKLGGGEVDFVLITRKEVQRLESMNPQEIVKIGQKSDVNVVIVVEPLKIDYAESSTKKDDEFCVLRKAKVLVSAKVHETKRGDVLMAGVYEGKADAKQCSKGVRRTDKLPSKDALIIKALKDSASKFAKEFWSSL